MQHEVLPVNDSEGGEDGDLSGDYRPRSARSVRDQPQNVADNGETTDNGLTTEQGPFSSPLQRPAHERSPRLLELPPLDPDDDRGVLIRCCWRVSLQKAIGKARITLLGIHSLDKYSELLSAFSLLN